MRSATLALVLALAVAVAGCSDDADDQARDDGPSVGGEIADAEQSADAGAAGAGSAEGQEVASDAAAPVNPMLPLARFAAIWAPETAACGTAAQYRFTGRAVYAPDSRCIVFSSDTVEALLAEGDDPSAAGESGGLDIRLFCAPGAEGPLPQDWPMPPRQQIDTWLIEPRDDAVPATAIRVDRGPEGVLDLVRCTI